MPPAKSATPSAPSVTSTRTPTSAANLAIAASVGGDPASSSNSLSFGISQSVTASSAASMLDAGAGLSTVVAPPGLAFAAANAAAVTA